MATLDLATAYDETRRSVTALVRDLDGASLATPVPATPNWSVRDAVAHLTGVAQDLVIGEGLEAYGAVLDRSSLPALDLRTSEQVGSRRAVPFDAVLEEWSSWAERLLPILRGEGEPLAVPFADRMIVTDVATHAQDVRGALGRPGDRESLGVGVAFASYAGGLHLRLAGSGLPALRIAYGGKHRDLGDGEPAATVRAERFELYRAMGGRRSRRQILAFDWTGEPEHYLPLIPAYGERADDLVE